MNQENFQPVAATVKKNTGSGLFRHEIFLHHDEGEDHAGSAAETIFHDEVLYELGSPQTMKTEDDTKPRCLAVVIPPHAGNQVCSSSKEAWIPAGVDPEQRRRAGMTEVADRFRKFLLHTHFSTETRRP